MSEPARQPAHHMVAPAWDLLFVINLPWLIFAALHVLFLRGHAPDLSELTVYMVTLPHRFMTLALVFLDRDQLSRRPRMFVGLPVVFALVYLLSRSIGSWLTGGVSVILCLFAVDYAWNAWHFGAQHAGILRIYSRKAGGGRPRLEKFIFTTAVVYTMIACAGWHYFDGVPDLVYTVLDLAVVSGLISLIALELIAGIPSVPKLLYMSSVSLLYGGILALPHLGLHQWRLGFIGATGFFHAVEYLAIVSFYVKGKHRNGGFGGGLLSGGLFVRAVPMWGLTLILFMLSLGLCGLVTTAHAPQAFAFVYLIGSFMHYAYDGMIWKLRKPNVARVLGAEVPS